MTNLTKIVKLLHDHNILAILTGDIALRIYNSPCVANDNALAIRTLDVDGCTIIGKDTG